MARTATINVSIQAAPTTVLGNAVAALNAQIAGGGSRWLQFSGNGEKGLGTALCFGTTNMLEFTHDGAWDPGRTAANGFAHLIGQPHGTGLVLRHIIYSEAADQWSIGESFPFAGHGYDHTVCDQRNGNLYHAPYGSGTPICRKLFGQAWNFNYVSKPAISNITYGCDIWTGPLTGKLDSQSVLLIYEADFGQIWRLNLDTGAWLTQAVALNLVYQQLLAYSPVYNCALYGGGNDSEGGTYFKSLARYNSNATETVISTEASPTLPASISLGVRQCLLFADPVSGKFVYIGQTGEIWEIDPTGSVTFSQKTGSQYSIPGGASGPNLPSGTSNTVAVIRIPTYNVVMLVSVNANTPSTARTWLYKHS